MHIQKAHMIYFSPANHTKKYCQQIANMLPWTTEMIDITPFASSLKANYDDTSLVVIALPSFGGRVPPIVLERLRQVHATHTPCMLAVTFGNRDFDDTLLELKEWVTASGFVVLGACALVCEHSIMPCYGTGRPHAQDLVQVDAFLQSIIRKIAVANQPWQIQVKGHFPYRETTKSPFLPKTSDQCQACGKCYKECPTHAISQEDPSITNSKLCVSCMRCVTICPYHAKHLPPEVLKASIEKMAAVCSTYKENYFSLL